MASASAAEEPLVAVELPFSILDLATEARKLLQLEDLDSVSVRDFRRKLAVHLGRGQEGLEGQADDMQQVLTEAVQELMAVRDAKRSWMLDEVPDARTSVYLVTFANVLNTTALHAATPLKTLEGASREAIRDAILDAVAHPEREAGGRTASETLSVVKMVVFKEEPLHFHAALRLDRKARFLQFKKSLRQRAGFASHWSSTHSMFWSAVRYGVFATEHKAQLDPQPLTWTADGSPLDLYEESQRPWSAEGVKKRREALEAQSAAASGANANKRAARFTKLDFNALVLSRQLQTPSQVMLHVQKHGSRAMQEFVTKNQRRLKDLLQEAADWQQAESTAALEKESDWDLIQRLAGEACVCQGGCGWRDAAAAFFQRNAESIDEGHFAQCLAKIICEGPSKTVRVPLLAGPSNSGKSTVLDPLDDVFGAECVQHKPDIGSTMPLVNITKPHKRFMYLDEFQCVEYAAVPARKPTIPVSTMLKLLGGQYFEVQVSQSFHDGNMDCRWRRGIAITSKSEGLWSPRGSVTPEDIVHLRNRVEQFTANSQLDKKVLRAVVPCKYSFCKWVTSASKAFTERRLLQLPVSVGDCDRSSGDAAVAGLFALLESASIPAEWGQRLHDEALALGAVGVDELSREDWLGLPSWAALKPLQQRRVLDRAFVQTSVASGSRVA